MDCDNFNDDLGLQSDPVSTLNVDPGNSLDIVPALHRDFGLNMDNPNSTVDTQLIHCVNCGADVTHRRRHILNLNEVRHVILQWIAPQVIDTHSQICHSCWTVALLNSPNVSISNEGASSSGHQRQICVSCSTSLMRIRTHNLNMDSDRVRDIRNVIIDWINPRELRAPDRICHPCWQRADRQVTQNAERRINEHEVQNPDGTIHLPDYRRAADTQAHCFFPGCNGEERLMIPKWLRVHIFEMYNYYIPQQCRICQFHLRNDHFHVLEDDAQSLHYFRVSHIQDFASFVKERRHHLDFRRIDDMTDDTLYYWTGVTKEQFQLLKADIPNIDNMPNNTLALAAFLIKIRTGDANERLSMLLNIPRTTLARYINKVRDILLQDFVPRNVGIEHMSRSQISDRNLIIPNGLFGGDERKPIIIMDGTYLYLQKSSNYKYQKDTYSFHKYRNLMKPFLMVCSDGYIIDVLGPYPATMSDATILVNEFKNHNTTLRRYFQPGDVFILDRGFRDCVPLLQECQYSVHVPLCLQQGETQLTTAAANKSRTVTICRWVVEAVNGIFKMSYKLFRSEFFNTASKHAISDFRIAAALINRFHARISDRPDANLILNRVLEKLNTENMLADYVILNNLNRRRTQFSDIQVSMDNNLLFPRLELNELILLACGTYQLKQARSYYGEHIRSDGSYTVEVCADRASNLMPDFPSSGNCTLLRAKIQSRHISRRTYFIYILFNNNSQDLNAIKGYCCNCIVGRRTVGCCSHIMSVIWYLSWARYESVTPPARFLDNILVTYNSDEEN